MSHTPGPWKVSRAIFDAEDGEVGYVLEGVKEARSDDAALIEAAPGMLEVLEWLNNEFDCSDDDYGCVVFTRNDFEKVRAVIKKARVEE